MIKPLASLLTFLFLSLLCLCSFTCGGSNGSGKPANYAKVDRISTQQQVMYELAVSNDKLKLIDYKIPEDGEAGKRLLILVHGINSDAKNAWIKGGEKVTRMLASEIDYNKVLLLDYPDANSPIDEGLVFQKYLCGFAGGARIDIVAHSLGGLVTRAALEKGSYTDIKAKVENAVFIGTPHHGSSRFYNAIVPDYGMSDNKENIDELVQAYPSLQFITNPELVEQLLPPQTTAPNDMQYFSIGGGDSANVTTFGNGDGAVNAESSMYLCGSQPGTDFKVLGMDSTDAEIASASASGVNGVLFVGSMSHPLIYQHVELKDRAAENNIGKLLVKRLRGSLDWSRGVKILKTLNGHTGEIRSLSYSPDGRYLATGSSDNMTFQGIVKIWNVSSGGCLKTLNGHTSPVTSVVWSPDGQYLATGSQDNTAKIWKVDTGKCFKTFSGFESGVESVVYAPDGRYIATACKEKVKIWSVETGVCFKTLSGHKSSVNSISYSPDGKHLAIAVGEILDYTDGDYELVTKIYETESGSCIKTLSGHSDSVDVVAYSPDGRYVATGSRDNSAKIWDVASGNCIQTLSCTNEGWGVMALAFSHDGRYLATGCGGYSETDNLIKIWDCESGKCVTSTPSLKGGVLGIAWSPDGKYLAGVNGNYNPGSESMEPSAYDCVIFEKGESVSSRNSGELIQGFVTSFRKEDLNEICNYVSTPFIVGTSNQVEFEDEQVFVVVEDIASIFDKSLKSYKSALFSNDDGNEVYIKCSIPSMLTDCLYYYDEYWNAEIKLTSYKTLSEVPDIPVESNTDWYEGTYKSRLFYKIDFSLAYPDEVPSYNLDFFFVNDTGAWKLSGVVLTITDLL